MFRSFRVPELISRTRNPKRETKNPQRSTLNIESEVEAEVEAEYEVEVEVESFLTLTLFQ